MKEPKLVDSILPTATYEMLLDPRLMYVQTFPAKWWCLYLGKYYFHPDSRVIG